MPGDHQLHRLTWNLCTSFAAVGALLAYAILALMFGIHWQLLPGALLGLLAAYVVSAALGAKLSRIGAGRSLVVAIILGCAVALLTLLAGALAVCAGNFAVETIREVAAAPAGQPLWNRLVEFIPDNAIKLLLTPLLVGVLIGAVPALALGLVFGVVLHARTDHQGSASPGLRVWAGGGAGLVVAVLAGIWWSMFSGVSRTSESLADGATVFGGCGEIALGEGVLAYCRSFSCTMQRCDYRQPEDALAILVKPPPNAGWSWAGGGLGSTTRFGEFAHNIYWVKRGPNGFLNEHSPRRHQQYRLRLDGEELVIGDEVFPFRHGMLLIVKYEQDWSLSVFHGSAALRETHLTVADLQRALDDSCAEMPACEQAFQINDAQK